MAAELLFNEPLGVRNSYTLDPRNELELNHYDIRLVCSLVTLAQEQRKRTEEAMSQLYDVARMWKERAEQAARLIQQSQGKTHSTTERR